LGDWGQELNLGGKSDSKSAKEAIYIVRTNMAMPEIKAETG
jgi:hypothetical protein